MERSLKLLGSLLTVLFLTSPLSAETRIKEASEQITRTGNDSTFKKELRVEIWDVQQRTEIVQQTYRWKEVDCNYNPGDGTPGWHNFFSLPLADKPQALADSIAGIDRDLARRIINSPRGFLETRPVDWTAFRKEIARIDSDLPAHGLYYYVVIINGAANRRNLGYEYGGASNLVGAQTPKAAAGDYNAPTKKKDSDYNTPSKKKDNDYNAPSKKKDNDYNNAPSKTNTDYNTPSPQKPADPIVCREYDREETEWIPVTRDDSRLVDVRTKRVTILFENSVLLNGESESFVLTWDGKSEQIGINKSAALNQYAVSIDAQGEVYTLKGSGRVPARPAAGDFSASLSSSGGKIYLSVTDARGEELGRLSKDYGLQVSFNLYQKGSKCGSDKLVGTKSVKLSSGSGQIDVTAELGQSLEAGKSYRITGLTFQRLNTTYFSNEASGGVSTEWVNY